MVDVRPGYRASNSRSGDLLNVSHGVLYPSSSFSRILRLRFNSLTTLLHKEEWPYEKHNFSPHFDACFASLYSDQPRHRFVNGFGQFRSRHFRQHRRTRQSWNQCHENCKNERSRNLSLRCGGTGLAPTKDPYAWL